MALATIAPALFAALGYVAWVKAGWFDEFYTLYVAQPRFDLMEALSEHWLPDNHPPLYYALAWATWWLGPSLEERRFLNLLIALAAFASVWVVARSQNSRSRATCVFYLLVIAALAPPLLLAGELRSYFLSFCSLAVLSPVLVFGRIDDWLPNAAGRALVWAWIVIALNTHIVTTVVAGCILLPFLVAAFVRGEWARFRLLAMPAAAGGALFLATTAVQFSLWMKNTGEFWIPGGMGQALSSFEMVLYVVLAAQPLMVFGGLAGLYFIIRQTKREGRAPDRLEAALSLAGGVFISSAVLLALHAWRPLLIPKYLVPLFPPIALLVALSFGALLEQVERRIGAVLVVAAAGMTLLALWHNTGLIKLAHSWAPTAIEIRRQVEACPSTTVHVEMDWNIVQRRREPPDNAEVVPFGYETVARRHRFSIEPPRSLRMSDDCPTLFWGQRLLQDIPTAQEVLARERARGFPLTNVWLYRINPGWEEGWIASDRLLDLPPDVPVTTAS